MGHIEKGKRVGVWTTNGGYIEGTLYESYTESYGVLLEELPKEIYAGRVKEVCELTA